MSIESFLSGKLRRFTVVDIGFVKVVYFLFGLLVFSVYPPLVETDWWFFLAIALACGLPLGFHFFSFAGSLLEKGQAYAQSNLPAYQVLLFMTQFFFALTLGSLFPVLASGDWWVYVLIMIVAAIKPLTKTWFW